MPLALKRPFFTERQLPWLVFLAAFALYVFTLYPGVGGRHQWGDAAKWQYLGSILGVSHPPGSPLYVLLTYAWSLLPWPDELALRIGLFSSLCGAAAVALAFALLRRLGVSVAAASLGALAFATAQCQWVFSTEAEVYALLGLAWVFVLHRFVLWHDTRRIVDYWVGCAAYAVAFGNHYTMLTLFPALAVLVLWTDWRGALRPRRLLLVVAAVALGLLPMVWLWFWIPHAPYSEIPGELTWGKFWDYLFARQYRSGIFAFTFEDFLLGRTAWGVANLGRQVGFAALALAPLGVYALGARSPRLATFFALAAAGPFVFWIGYRVGDELGGSLPVVVCVALLFAAAADFILARIPPRRWRALALALGVVLLAPGIYYNLKGLVGHDPMQRLSAEVDHAKRYRWDLPCLLQSVEPGAIVVPPFHDYGSRQIVNYHLIASPIVRQKHVRFEYLDEPRDDWHWAPRVWKPDPKLASPVYVFQEGHATALRNAGYRVEGRELDLAACGVRAKPMRFFYGIPQAAP
jgi:hypothetical protein